jgi:hypothetical protein
MAAQFLHRTSPHAFDAKGVYDTAEAKEERTSGVKNLQRTCYDFLPKCRGDLAVIGEILGTWQEMRTVLLATVDKYQHIKVALCLAIWG